jgi:hypothetical protein
MGGKLSEGDMKCQPSSSSLVSVLKQSVLKQSVLKQSVLKQSVNRH